MKNNNDDDNNNNNNDIVEVLQGPSEYTRTIRKDATARWVRGLTPVELEEAFLKRQKKAEALENEKGFWGKGKWLRVPIILGILYCVFLTHTIINENKRHPLDFPLNEEELWEYVAKSKGNFKSQINKVSCASSLSALFTLTLSWIIGTAAHHFWALCGVGISLLSLMAIFGQIVMIWFACDISPISRKEECYIPFVLYWTFSVARLGGPLLALWCVTPVLDFIRNSRILWRFLLGIPVLTFSVTVILLVMESTLPKEYNLYLWINYLTLITWSLLLISCFKQSRFHVVFMSKQHED